jgi:phosphatidylserine/phosphatidylglycerophosphate/cardiolipin synthase-like enzyme
VGEAIINLVLKKNLPRQTLSSGLAYGLGLTIGSALQIFIAGNVSFAPGRDQETDFNFLLVGVLLAFLISALTGGIGGFIGGWTLPVVDRPRGRWGYTWQGAISLAIPTGLFLFVTLISISLLTFYSAPDDPPSQFALIFALTGVFYGLLIGLLLGMLTVGWRRSGRVILYALFGFGLGGVGYGLGLREFLMSVSNGDLATGNILYLFLGIAILGFLGGSALGMIYSRLATEPPPSHQSFRLRPIAAIILAVIVILLIISLSAMSPFLDRLSAVLTPRSAGLSATLASDTTGTHWSDPIAVTSMKGEPARAALAATDEQIALVWQQTTARSSTIMYQPGRWNADIQGTEWASPVTVDQSDEQKSEPQVALDKDGVAHIVWRDRSVVFYSRCHQDECTEPTALSEELPSTCGGVNASTLEVWEQQPAVAVSEDSQLMVVWHGPDGRLLYTTSLASLPLGIGASDCVPADEAGSAAQLKLVGGPDSRFTLVFAHNRPGSEILALNYDGNAWDRSAVSIGNGHSPQVLMDAQDQIHFAWCGDDDLVNYWQAGRVEVVAELSCQNRPDLAMDSDGVLHITWLSDEVTQTTGTTAKRPLVYESIQMENAWIEPAIVARPNQAIQPAMVGDGGGVLHHVWREDRLDQPVLAYASQVQYDCDDITLPRIAQGALAVAKQTQYQPAGDTVPYCKNRYDRLLYTPGPDSTFSNQALTPNGGFDGLAELIKSADYEAHITTMEYRKDVNDDSPGSVVAAAVAELYDQLKSDPSRYPRGLTVRILLGNRPPLGELELNALLWRLLSDLRDAGVPEMVNSDLGWRLEVANYEGAWPHSHAKIAVIDGKTLVAAGFNMEYHHLAPDHSSGLGKGTADVAIQVTGPVAQDGRLAFDELWGGATQRHCTNFFPDGPDQLWRLSCRDKKAMSDHVPEVKRYYLPGGESIAFSLLRTTAYDEADQQAAAAIAAAEERIDIMHTMFTLPAVCILNYLLDVCSAVQAMPYMQGILDAVEHSEANVRLLIDLEPIKGVENALALGELQAEIKARGLNDRIEIRPFPGPVHAKNTLIDDQFLIVGSHNFHWSAFGEGQGLAEYSLGVTDPQAISEFKRYFDYQWKRAEHE